MAPADLGSCRREFMLVGRMSKKHNGTISHLITSVTKATGEAEGVWRLLAGVPASLGSKRPREAACALRSEGSMRWTHNPGRWTSMCQVRRQAGQGSGAEEFCPTGVPGTRILYCVCSLLNRYTFPSPFLPNGHLWMELGSPPLFTTLILWGKMNSACEKSDL